MTAEAAKDMSTAPSTIKLAPALHGAEAEGHLMFRYVTEGCDCAHLNQTVGADHILLFDYNATLARALPLIWHLCFYISFIVHFRHDKGDICCAAGTPLVLV